MTAEPLPDWSPRDVSPPDRSLPEWFYPGPPGGWTADDLDHLPSDAPRHVELIDGALFFMNPQTKFHMLVISRLQRLLTEAASEGLDVAREMTITLGRRQRPEPDVLVVRDDHPEDLTRTSYLPHEVLLAVEVVSADSEERDRKVKPKRYAAAGIQHFWRVENEGGKAVIYVYERDETSGRYVPTVIARDRLKLAVPFDIDIDVTRLTR